MFIISNDYENIVFVMMARKITRMHDITLVKEQITLYVRKRSFSLRNINVWNTLSTDCGLFKNRTDTHLY